MTASNKTEFKVEPGKQEITITRMFDAPRHEVYKLATDPKNIPNWWGPREMTTTVEKMEMRPGGRWRYIQHNPRGQEFAFYGVYHDVIPNEKLIYTFEFGGVPGHIMLQTDTFEDINGRTKLTTHVVFESVEDRDGMYKSGMEKGIIESHERFEELLSKTKPKEMKHQPVS